MLSRRLFGKVLPFLAAAATSGPAVFVSNGLRWWREPHQIGPVLAWMQKNPTHQIAYLLPRIIGAQARVEWTARGAEFPKVLAYIEKHSGVAHMIKYTSPGQASLTRAGSLSHPTTAQELQRWAENASGVKP